MTVTLRRHHFSAAERQVVAEAVMTGAHVDEVEGLEDVAMQIAEMLPELLRHARRPDTSENRRELIDFVLERWSEPKSARPSRSYRQLRR